MDNIKIKKSIENTVENQNQTLRGPVNWPATFTFYLRKNVTFFSPITYARSIFALVTYRVIAKY